MFKKDLPERAQQLADTLAPLAKNAVTVLEKRYFTKDQSGNLTEDADGALWRVASHIAKEHLKHITPFTQDEIALEYYLLMRDHRFLPNSPTIANAGTRTGQLSACFVLPISDGLANTDETGIYDTLRNAQLIQQTGGGVGFSFGRIRRKGGFIKTTMGEASGVLSWADVFDIACDKLKQGGVRRGAQMLILPVNHPEIMEFIAYKSDLTKLTNFNVSVGATNEFLDKLMGVDPDPMYQLVDPSEGPINKFLNAKEVFNTIVQRAWATGEPGIVFLDRMNAHNPNPGLGVYEATNPCGEQPLVPYESCNLGSITLDTYVEKDSSGIYTFNWKSLEKDIYWIISMMDDTIDANEYVAAKGHNPGVAKIKEVTLQTRKLGLGIMGMARMLFKLGLAYDSPEGRQLCEEVYAFIDLNSKKVSIELAKVRGMFPYMEANIDEVTAFYEKDWLARAEIAEQNGLPILANGYKDLIPAMKKYGVRNSTTTTIAPTGTISIIHDTSGGCEPQFALVISRNQAGIKMHEADKVFANDLIDNGFNEDEIQQIFEIVGTHRGSLKEALPSLEELYKDNAKTLETLRKLAKVYVVAGDVSPEDHVRMQAALQKYCDSAISKTVNFPHEATEEDVAEVYRLAIELGCKGVTVYRDGSRSYQPLTAGDRQSGEVVAAKDKEIFELKAKIAKLEAQDLSDLAEPRQRAERLYGFNERITTGDGKLYATVGYDNKGIREVIVEVGKAGGVLNGLVEAIGRLISLALKYHVPVTAIASALRYIRSANTYGFGPKQILSIPDAIGKLLEEAPASLENQLAHAEIDIPKTLVTLKVADFGENPECPQCGSLMKMGEGCKGGTCTDPSCGYAKC